MTIADNYAEIIWRLENGFGTERGEEVITSTGFISPISRVNIPKIFTDAYLNELHDVIISQIIEINNDTELCPNFYENKFHFKFNTDWWSAMGRKLIYIRNIDLLDIDNNSDETELQPACQCKFHVKWNGSNVIDKHSNIFNQKLVWELPGRWELDKDPFTQAKQKWKATYEIRNFHMMSNCQIADHISLILNKSLQSKLKPLMTFTCKFNTITLQFELDIKILGKVFIFQNDYFKFTFIKDEEVWKYFNWVGEEECSWSLEHVVENKVFLYTLVHLVFTKPVNNSHSSYVCASFNPYDQNNKIGTLHDEIKQDFPYNGGQEFTIWFIDKDGVIVKKPHLNGTIHLELKLEKMNPLISNY
ncbi:MAG: hypothetical protein LBR24_03175 [Methanobrevibacter sp.]|jgi:hypothetical protein|nr:hypothetical protein [Methanobrevibacter sp.]